MQRPYVLALYFAAIFLQSGAYGLTFMLPRLFAGFGADEKTVGSMLFLTTIATILSVYYSGHLSDLFGRLKTLGIACVAISAALGLFALATSVGVMLVTASVLLGFGWGLTYSLGPIVLTRIVYTSERVQFFALLSVFVMAGFGLAPVLASLFERAGLGLPSMFLLTSGMCFVSAVIFFAIDGAIRALALDHKKESPSRITLSALRQVLGSKAITPIVMVFLGASVFAGLNNFQTVFADARGLNYATFFLVYTCVVIVFRLVLVKFKGGPNPYLTITLLQYLMCASVVLFLFSADSAALYVVIAVLFGLGYGVSYPILVAMAAQDAPDALGPQTLQIFALTYFLGVFGFPLVAGWLIVEIGAAPLLWLVAALAGTEATLALRRALFDGKP